MRCLIGFTAACVLLCLTPIVQAQESTLVFGLGAPDVSSDRLDYLHAELIAGVDLAENSDAVDAVHQTLSEALMLVGCSQIDPMCVGLLGEAFGADRVLYGTASPSGSFVEVSITVHDASDGNILLFERFDVPDGAPESWVADRLRSFLNGCGVIDLTGPGIATVEMDGALVQMGTAGTLPNVPLGAHSLRVNFLDGRTGEVSVNVDSIGVFPVSVSPAVVEVADPRTTRPSDPRADRGTNGVRVTGWTLVGVGGGALVASLVSGLQANSTQSEFDDTQIQREAQALADEGNSQARRANVFLGVGLGAAALGTTLVIIGRDRHDGSAEIGISPWGGFVRANF